MERANKTLDRDRPSHGRTSAGFASPKSSNFAPVGVSRCCPASNHGAPRRYGPCPAHLQFARRISRLAPTAMHLSLAALPASLPPRTPSPDSPRHPGCPHHATCKCSDDSILKWFSLPARTATSLQDPPTSPSAKS